RRRYSKEFKDKAVELAEDGNVAETARWLGINRCNTSRTALSRASGEYLIALFMALPSQELASGKVGAVQPAPYRLFRHRSSMFWSSKNGHGFKRQRPTSALSACGSRWLSGRGRCCTPSQ